MAHDLELDLKHVVQHTASIWPRLAGANILLTGASGFVGTWLTESFLWANQQFDLKSKLFALTRDAKSIAENRPNLHLLTGDLKTFPFPLQPLDFIIHAAAEHEGPGLDCIKTVAANVEGTRRVLELARASGVRKVLYTSSGAAYGVQPPELDYLPEDFVSAPQSYGSYAQSKQESERLCEQSANAELQIVIARLFAFVGPYLPVNKNFAVGNFVRDAASGVPIRIEGDGTPLRSYLYAADLAIWLWTLLLDGKSVHPYNVGSDQPISIRELAKTVEQVSHSTHGIAFSKTAGADQKPQRYVPSIQRARQELGLQPWIALPEGVRRMFEWQQAQASMK